MNRLKGFVTVIYLANIFREILCLRTVPSQLHLTVESRGLSTDTHKSDLAHCISVPREKTYKADSQHILVRGCRTGSMSSDMEDGVQIVQRVAVY